MKQEKVSFKSEIQPKESTLLAFLPEMLDMQKGHRTIRMDE